MLKKFRKLFVIVVSNLVMLFLIAEIVGLGYYGVKKGALYYSAGPSGEFVPGERAIKVLDSVFHPYFGYVHRQNREWANNEGMGWAYIRPDENCCDLPIIPNKDQILVGVFGGSVAREFATYNRKFLDLPKLLTERYPEFKGKTITVVNFSMSGYRQPQQLMMLTYYLMRQQAFDIVINIDGYNEVYHGMLNAERGIEISFPAEDIWGKMHEHLERLNMRLDDSEAVASVYYESLARAASKAADQCSLASCYLYETILEEVYNQIASNIRADFGGDWKKVSHFIRYIPDPKNPDGKNVKRNFTDPKDVYKAIADYWSQASMMMAQMCAERGIVYLHIVQPNLHYKTHRQFPIKNETSWTKKFAEPVVDGYPYLLNAAKKATEEGYEILAPMTIFDDAPIDNIYIDDCCHYTEPGNKIFTEYVAEQIDRHWRVLHGNEAPQGEQ